MLDNACEAEEVDVIGDFALPLQSQALTMMLGVPASDAVEFVSWGIHAIRENGQNSPVKAAVVPKPAQKTSRLSRNTSTMRMVRWCYELRCTG